MSSGENGRIQYEGGQTSYPMAALTNSGDAQLFTSVAAPWSRRAGFSPVIRVNGVLTGLVSGGITPGGSNNVVNIAAFSCNLAGAVVSVNAGTLTATRPATAVSKVISLTVDSSGALAAVAGTDGASAAFSETRGAAGGPALIPTGSIELGQVRYTSNTAALVQSTEIFSVPGVHQERADAPYTVDYRMGRVSFIAPLPAIHTGNVPRAVWASYAVPIFADVPNGTNYVAPETTHSVSSIQVYAGTIGSSSSTLQQGSFTAYLEDGVTDPLVGQKNQTLWFRHYPDRTKSPYTLANGKLGIARTWPADGQIQAACTISAESAAVEVA